MTILKWYVVPGEYNTQQANYGHFVPFLADESRAFTEGEENVRTVWTNFVKSDGAVLAQPEHYITLK